MGTKAKPGATVHIASMALLLFQDPTKANAKDIHVDQLVKVRKLFSRILAPMPRAASVCIQSVI